MPPLTNITIAGVLEEPSTVMFNQQKINSYKYDQDTQVLIVAPVEASMKETISLMWY